MIFAAFALTACGGKEPEETAFDKFAKDWYAYKMTTITDGVESPDYGDGGAGGAKGYGGAKGKTIATGILGWATSPLGLATLMPSERGTDGVAGANGADGGTSSPASQWKCPRCHSTMGTMYAGGITRCASCGTTIS